MNFTHFKEKYQRVPILSYHQNVPANVLVSVIVQTYNHENYITECLDSILDQQTNFDFEILVGEDNSTDKTRQICKDYAQRFPNKIRLFLHSEENKILVFNKPTGNFNSFYNLFSSSGKYIAFCEGDDFWQDKSKLQKQVDFLEKNPLTAFTYHRYIQIDSEGKLLPENSLDFQPDFNISSKELKLCDFHPLLLTVCFRNKIDNIPEEILHIINVDTFLFSLLGAFGNAEYLPSIEASRYRKQGTGIWSNRQQKLKFESKIKTYDALYQYYTQINDRVIAEGIKRKLINAYKSLVLIHLKSGRIKGMIRIARKLL